MPSRVAPLIRAMHPRTALLVTGAAALLLAACSAGASPVPPTPAPTAAMTEPAMMSASPEPAMSPAMTEPAMTPATMDHPTMSASPEPAMTEPAMSPAMSPAMTDHPTMSASPGAATTAATGTFHAVDGKAAGTVALIHLADGSFALSFEGFSVASAAHVDVLLVKAGDVMHSTDVNPASALDLGALKGTSGMQDFSIPPAMSSGAMEYHGVVLWDTQMGHAIAAATLMTP